MIRTPPSPGKGRCLAAGLGKPQGKESGRAAWLAAELAALPPQALVFAAASEFAPDAGHKPPGGPRPVHSSDVGTSISRGAAAPAGTLGLRRRDCPRGSSCRPVATSPPGERPSPDG